MRKKKENNSEVNEIVVDINNGRELNEMKKLINKLIPNEIKVVAKNDSQKKLINSIKANEITICAGLAGTGKSFVSIAYALSLLKKPANSYKKIYLVKSVTTLKGEELGYLKGDINDKIDPFMWSFYMNMEKVVSKPAMKLLIENEIIVPFPLAYMRGVTLDDCIIIGDEFQNVSVDNSRTLLTRIGSNSKIILLGDYNQIDMKKKDDSSLQILLNLFNGVENIGCVSMSDDDINVRNPLISTIESKYRQHYNTDYKNNKIILND